MRRRCWNKRGIAHLVRDYATVSTVQIARSMGRTARQVYKKAISLGLRKSPEYFCGPYSDLLRHVGAPSRFPKGHTPWNKGLKGWTAGGRSAETRFKPGNYSKRWDREIYTIGALRINSDGGLDIRVREGLRAWDPLSRFTWQTERGAIPRGMVVRFKNGDTHDTRIENLRLATRPELMRQNTLHRYPKPIARAIQLRGALNRRINRLEEERGQNA